MDDKSENVLEEKWELSNVPESLVRSLNLFCCFIFKLVNSALAKIQKIRIICVTCVHPIICRNITCENMTCCKRHAKLNKLPLLPSGSPGTYGFPGSCSGSPIWANFPRSPACCTENSWKRLFELWMRQLWSHPAQQHLSSFWRWWELRFNYLRVTLFVLELQDPDGGNDTDEEQKDRRRKPARPPKNKRK